MELLKLLGAVAVIWGVVVLLYAFPFSHGARIAFTWYGPAPLMGETRAHYRVRRSAWSLGLFFQMVALFYSLTLAIRWYPQLQGTAVEFIAMILPLSSLLVLFVVLWYALTAAKAKLLGPNPTFQLPQSGIEV